MHKTVLIGCGDIARRISKIIDNKSIIYGLSRSPEKFPALRAAGITPIPGDLDKPDTLHRLAGLADTVIHLAPPPPVDRTAHEQHDGRTPADTRTRHLLAALSRGKRPRTLIYISTSGVYGDCKGARVDETHPASPLNSRAKLRLDAERQIRRWARRNKVSARILRVPGIYAEDRLPLDRLKKGTPAIIASEDGYTNHIHADDLARCVLAALRHGRTGRIYHTVDDSNLRMGEYFDAVADSFLLPRPPRISRAEAQQVLSPMLLSFMNESRQLDNRRMKQELKVSLLHPTVGDLLATLRPPVPRREVSAAQPASAQLEMFPPAQ